MAFTKKEIKALILYYERVRPGFVGIPGNPPLYDWVEDYRWKHQPPLKLKKLKSRLVFICGFLKTAAPVAAFAKGLTPAAKQSASMLLKNRTQALKASRLGSKLESTEMTKGWFGRMTKGWFGRTKRGPQRRCLFPCRQAPPC